jgi:hypothetical protein
MAKERNGLGAPRSAVVRPLVLLALGITATVVLWQYLMLDPGGTGGVRTERLSPGDRQALDHVLRDQVR